MMISVKAEVLLINILLVALILVYVNLLFGAKSTLPSPTTKFIIDKDTNERWKLKSEGNGKSYTSDKQSEKSIGADDYYSYDGEKEKESRRSRSWEQEAAEVLALEAKDPIVPSAKFRCPPHPPDWITIRSELNYKYLWLHGKSNEHMSATATLDTPLHFKAFEVVPVQGDCSDGGWVRLREGDTQGFLRMIPSKLASKTKTGVIDGGNAEDPAASTTVAAAETDTAVQAESSEDILSEDENAWAVMKGSSDLTDTKTDHSYHFLLEEEGYLLNRGSHAFVNVISKADFLIRGHASTPPTRPARREFNAMMRMSFVNETLVHEAIVQEETEKKEAADFDAALIKQIQSFPKSAEVRVISFGLYGSIEKYTLGAIRNTELAKIYFPGWTCRFYCTSDVPKGVIETLSRNGAEIVSVPDGEGYISGMFWRFLVAVDAKVDRFIVRDVDSRLNSREAMAVHEWIESGYEVHLMRDHVNHCYEMNGGMWGGVKGSMSFLKTKMDKWKSKDQYFQDMDFLKEEIWPEVVDKQIAHDSYCCDRYTNARPFPTRRPPTYQHVGQVFDKDDKMRISDIDGYIRGVPVPRQCRLHADWIYG